MEVRHIEKYISTSNGYLINIDGICVWLFWGHIKVWTEQWNLSQWWQISANDTKLSLKCSGSTIMSYSFIYRWAPMKGAPIKLAYQYAFFIWIIHVPVALVSELSACSNKIFLELIVTNCRCEEEKILTWAIMLCSLCSKPRSKLMRFSTYLSTYSNQTNTCLG